jgi:phosphoglycerate-specific signal transduction histidine kinase
MALMGRAMNSHRHNLSETTLLMAFYLFSRVTSIKHHKTPKNRQFLQKTGSHD